MKVIDPGHFYEVTSLDGVLKDNKITFVKREGDKYPGNVGSHAGTNLQEVLRVCIDRVKFLDKQEYHHTNNEVLYHLRNAIWELERRAAERHKRKFIRWPHNIEHLETCKYCGHIDCSEQCQTT